MTRPNQKDFERRIVLGLLNTLGIVPEGDPVAGEAPDFTVSIGDRTVGVEITTFNSGTMVDGSIGRRQVEAEWETLKRASDRFRNENQDIGCINVGLMFRGLVPSKNEHQAFMEEIAFFVRNRAGELGTEDVTFWAPHLKSPLMERYLRTLILRRGEFAEWYSNIACGWVGRPDTTLAGIIRAKSAKSYRPNDDLWLVIPCSYRPSEIMLPLNGVVDFEDVLELTAALVVTCFSRVFVLTPVGDFEWARTSGWRQIALDQTPRGQDLSFDELKSVLSDPEWLADPDGKADRVVAEVLARLRAGDNP